MTSWVDGTMLYWANISLEHTFDRRLTFTHRLFDPVSYYYPVCFVLIANQPAFYNALCNENLCQAFFCERPLKKNDVKPQNPTLYSSNERNIENGEIKYQDAKAADLEPNETEKSKIDNSLMNDFRTKYYKQNSSNSKNMRNVTK